MKLWRCLDCGGRVQDPEEAGYLACVRCWVERSCAQQGVPVTVTDPVTLRKVAVLLGS